MNLAQAVTTRYSCRNFQKLPIEPADLAALREFADQGSSLFGGRLRLAFVGAADHDARELRGLGTYGFIKNPRGFIIGVLDRAENPLEDFGYLLERLVLKATCLGLGSCWLGGSFTQSSFSARASLAPGEYVPAVIALGRPAPGKRLLEKAARGIMKADLRKPWAQLFFREQPANPLAPDTCGPWREPLEMLRLAPSSSNLQPWRLVWREEASELDFFLQRKKRLRRGRAHAQGGPATHRPGHRHVPLRPGRQGGRAGGVLDPKAAARRPRSRELGVFRHLEMGPALAQGCPAIARGCYI